MLVHSSMKMTTVKQLLYGGHTQGKVNAANGHLKNISKLPRNRKNLMWITDGTINTMIDRSTLELPNGFKTGKTQIVRSSISGKILTEYTRITNGVDNKVIGHDERMIDGYFPGITRKRKKI
jgi:hypothetical protein